MCIGITAAGSSRVEDKFVVVPTRSNDICDVSMRKEERGGMEEGVYHKREGKRERERV